MLKPCNVMLVSTLANFAAGVIGGDVGEDDPVNLYFDVDAYWHDHGSTNGDVMPPPESSDIPHSASSSHHRDIQHSVPSQYYGDTQHTISSSHRGDNIQSTFPSFQYPSAQSGRIDASSSVDHEGDALNNVCEASPSLSSDFDEVLSSFFASAGAQNHAGHTFTGRGLRRLSQIRTRPMDLTNAVGDIDGALQSTALLAAESYFGSLQHDGALPDTEMSDRPPVHCEHSLPVLADHYGRQYHPQPSGSHVTVHSVWHAHGQIVAAESWSPGEFLDVSPQTYPVETGLHERQQGNDVGIELITQAAAADIPASIWNAMEGCSGGNHNPTAAGESWSTVTHVEGAGPAEDFAQAGVYRDVGLQEWSIAASRPSVAGRPHCIRQVRFQNPTGGAGSSAVRPTHMPSSGGAPVPGRFVCARCNRRLSNQGSLYRHMEQNCPKRFEDPRFGCPFCDESFTCPDSVTRHVGTEHESAASTRRSCPTCREVIDKFHYLKLHVTQAHGGISCHPCPYCTDVLTSSLTLDNHVSALHSHYRRSAAGGPSEGASC